MNETSRTCQECGATITAEQISAREAGLIKGVLMCPLCVAAVRQAAVDARSATAEKGPAEQEESISLVAVDEASSGPSKIHSFATGSSLAGEHHDEKLNRPLTGPTEAPTRCRTFHSKLNDASIAYMDDQINMWIDSDERVFVKTVSTTVGTFEGKHPEPNLIITVFY
ncbi:MAG: hypothetical protein O7F76_08730 [Planctomycetota bacterium]|nr:hypothetical protein [Planctomycetota bacterium]MCZ6816757.1 hypothetical protein [Planctomycetota bacterium]